jgi:O-antigen/teichoic acid export membrane protein
MRVDQLILNNFLGDHSVGIYTAAIRITEIWYFIPMIILNTIMPKLLELREKCYIQYINIFIKLLRILIIINLIISFFICLIDKWLIITIYGSIYIESSNILKICIWSNLFTSINLVYSKWFIIEDKQHYGLSLSIISAIINIMLNYYLIKYHGLTGAAWATLIGYILCSIFIPIFFKKIRLLNSVLLQAIFGGKFI